ncbi:hypothetical protein BGX27_009066 [Mortierella sp. AM989]|nr:hypothetical protein BGX27_009066 [Mortierella sp. AM989]
MNSDLRAQLLELGFSLSQARAAVAAGNGTVESATEWIFENNSKAVSSHADSVGTNKAQDAPTLHLRDEQDDAFESDLQRALAESSRSQPVATTQSTESSIASSDSNSVKKIKINITRNQGSTPDTPLLPLSSRHKEEEMQAMNATRVAEATRRAEQLKKERMEARLARQRALEDLKQDKENRKLKGHAKPDSTSVSNTSTSNSTSGVMSTANSLPPTTTPISVGVATKGRHTMVQLRLKNGTILKRSYDSNDKLKDLFELARSEDGNIGSADISLIQPFPRREFTIADSDLTLSEAELCPSCSLNVFVQTPIPAPQPIVPNSWLPVDVEMEEPSSGQVQEPNENDSDEDQSLDDDNAGEDADEDEVVDEVEEEEAENEANDDDDMMHAMPMPFHPPQHPVPGNRRTRIPFSGAGHSLGSSSSSGAGNQPEVPVDSTSANADALRRQRILDAMANRTGNQSIEDTKILDKRLKKTKERTIPTLQSLCCYEVAVMLTAKDAKSVKNLKLLGENIGSQAAEGIVQELIKLKQLDQLTFKRLYRWYECVLFDVAKVENSIVNIVLDAYPRATDSLMDAIGASQSRSLTYLSLKECTFLTDNGLSNIGRFEELEFLDLSHCRVTDKTLEFILDLKNLNTLQLSATKITSNGLARAISRAVWKSTLQTLDVSYCEGISGSSVLVNLQELLNIRSLRLNNTLAFDQSPVRVPDQKAFTRLQTLDLARTPITSEDLITLIPRFKAVELLNLNSCIHISTTALECCANELNALENISFPNREHDLITVLPIAAGFLYVGDEAILSLSAAVNLQVLSLAGTKLTDVGSAVFIHMSSLKELLLDRTNIGDKTMEYLRDLGRLEILSLQRCERLTTAGMVLLGRCGFFSIKLKRLNLGYNKFIHDEALPVFARCHELNTLNLEYTDVSQERALRLQYSLPALKQLRIQGVTNGAVYEENPRPTFT